MASLNARFSAMESRLLRPSLGARASAPADNISYADKAKSKKAQSPVKAPVQTTTEVQATQAVAESQPASKPNKKKKGKNKKNKESAARDAPAELNATPAPPASASNATEWQTVGQRKAAKTKAKKQAKKAKLSAKRLRAPRSTAVVITLQPAAKEKGLCYAEVLKKAKEAIDLQQMQIESVKLKSTRTGARLFEIPGATSNAKADALAEKLRITFEETEVLVSRPTKTAELRIAGLDDSATSAEVATAVAKAAECSATEVRAGTIRPGFGGLGTVIVSCPIPAAKKVALGRKVLVGWVSASVKLLPPKPTKCYRCLAVGHLGVQCTSTVDCSDKCFRCSQPGHKADSCEATPHCFICAATNKPSEHWVSSKSCAAPKPRLNQSKEKAPQVEMMATEQQ